MVESVITSLAILKVNWDRLGQDYIENFVPFVAECLRNAPQPEISLPQLQGAISESFGLRIPQGALRTILRRCARRGYVSRIHGVYQRIDRVLSRVNLAQIRTSVMRRYEGLLQKLVDFCNERYQIRWTPEEAEAALLTYLENRSLPVLAAAVEGRPIPPPAREVKHAEFLVNSFVAHVHEADPEGFEFLETVVKGSMLANMLFFPDVGRVFHGFDGVEVYLDTRFLIRALGLAGPGLQSSSRDLMELVYQLGGALRCFEHTRNEIYRVLDACAHLLRDPARLRRAYGETIDYLIRAKYRSSDIELLIARFDESLEGLRVRVRAKPQHLPATGINEVKLERILTEEIGYASEEALVHDLDALTAIHRLRGGHKQPHIESCVAVFVTTNSGVARASARFFKEEYGNSSVPHCLLDHMFATLVWLKTATKAPDLPKKRIIADCYAALNPTDPLWKSYLEEIDRLQARGNISEEDYHLLRYSTEARRALMDLTFGEVDAFTEGTVEEVLERARTAARAEVEAALLAEKGKLLAETEKRLDAERRAAEAAERFEVGRVAQLRRLESVSVKVAQFVSRLLMYGGTLLLGFAVYLTIPEEFPQIPQAWLAWARPAMFFILFLFGLLSIANLSVGTTLRSLLRRLDVSLARMIGRALTRIMQP